jgi:hypothetical protein
MAYISFQPSDHFNTKLWTGNATNSTAITGVGFQPDFVWIKNRSTTANHNLFDAIRGATYRVYSDDTSAQVQATDSLASFDSDGFTLNNGSPCNGSGNSVVGWNWKANGQGSANTDGSINTTYTSANTTSGFSICQWTGTEAAATVGHGLGAVPKVMIVKAYDDSGGTDWLVYHHSIGNTKNLRLNTTDVEDTNANAWNSTTPTSSVFSVGNFNDTNRSNGKIIAYCFAEKKGFSKFGSYTGNGNADGSFIYTGFKPAFVLAKRTNAAESWVMFDNKRDPHNVVGHVLHPNNNTVESDQTSGTLYVMDFLSNGFKLKGTDTLVNGSGSTYIYMAFAEAPLVSSNGVPAVAR